MAKKVRTIARAIEALTTGGDSSRDYAADTCWRCDFDRSTTSVGLCDKCHAKLVKKEHA